MRVKFLLFVIEILHFKELHVPRRPSLLVSNEKQIFAIDGKWDVLGILIHVEIFIPKKTCEKTEGDRSEVRKF